MERTLRHLAIIMDGNRRWAKRQGLQVASAYREGGFGAVKRSVQFCLDQGVEYLSLYTFSLENFRRPQYEQDILFDAVVQEGKNAIPFFQEHGIRVKFIGDKTRFPQSVLQICLDIEQATVRCHSLFLNFLFCYGARQEMVCGIKKLFHKIKSGLLQEHDISEQTFADCLWTQDMPEPDLIVRTSGVKRLSNFLLYQAAYSEFFFLDCLWPEITHQDLHNATASFARTQRNFGV